MEDDGLAQEWHGSVYMNPPYGSAIDAWVAKLCREHESGRVAEAVALLPARTDAQWFRRLRPYPRCFIWGRLRFSDGDATAPFPSMTVYCGPRVCSFAGAFSDIGDVFTLWSPLRF